MVGALRSELIEQKELSNSTKLRVVTAMGCGNSTIRQ